MRRICLCLLILLACADVGAREAHMSSADGGSGGGSAETVPAPKADARKPAAPRDATPVREPRVRPSVHGDVGAAPRMRWHSFLPGMFR